jgi:hypothetical protein
MAHIIKYEYKIFDTGEDHKDHSKGNPDSLYDLNWLGDQGWLLVAIRKSDGPYGGERYYFVREKPNDSSSVEDR